MAQKKMTRPLNLNKLGIVFRDFVRKTKDKLGIIANKNGKFVDLLRRKTIVVSTQQSRQSKASGLKPLKNRELNNNVYATVGQTLRITNLRSIGQLTVIKKHYSPFPLSASILPNHTHRSA